MSEDERLPAQGDGGCAGSKIIRDTKLALGLISILIATCIAQLSTWADVAPIVVAIALFWVAVLAVRACVMLGTAIRNLNEILNFGENLLKTMRGDGALISLLVLTFFNGGALGIKATSEETRKREVPIIFHGADTSTVSSLQSTVVVDPVNPTLSFSIRQPEINVTSIVTISALTPAPLTAAPSVITAFRCCATTATVSQGGVRDIQRCWINQGMGRDTDIREDLCGDKVKSTVYFMTRCLNCD